MCNIYINIFHIKDQGFAKKEQNSFKNTSRFTAECVKTVLNFKRVGQFTQLECKEDK